MKVGLVCPYTWDSPGGVKAHVNDLAENLLALGHEVSVLAPVDEPDAPDLPSWVVPAGRAVPVPFNGSVARLCFGPISLARTRRWLRNGGFDVLHLHEPNVPSVSMLALWSAQGTIVATFHLSRDQKSLAILASRYILQTGLEKLTGRIAVSPAARTVVMEHLGGDAVLVPNGVSVSRFADAVPLPGLPDGPSVLFLGRLDEERKGLAVLLTAMPLLLARVPGVCLLVAGPGDATELLSEVPADVRERVRLLGLVPEADKPGIYAAATVYCAPNTHGESFGIVLAEAMATGTPVVASDLPAFRRVLQDGAVGVLFPNRDPDALAGALANLLQDPSRRASLAAAGSARVSAYDWTTVTAAIVAVYDAARAAVPPSAPVGEVKVTEIWDDPVDEGRGAELWRRLTSRNS